MRSLTSRVFVAAAIVLGASLQAQALTLSPSTPACGSPACIAETGNETSNDDILAAIADKIGTAVSVYKQNVGEGSDSGTFASSYVTTFSNTSSDPSNALIDYISGPFITGSSIWLVVKDGNQTPAWYLFNISNWNGTEDLVLQNFWPGNGAISHVEIFAGGTSVPDGGTTSMLLGLGLLGLAAVRRRLASRR